MPSTKALKKQYARRTTKRYRRRYQPRKYWFPEAYKTVAKYSNWEVLSKAIKDIYGLVNSEMYKLDTVEAGTIITSNPVTYVTHLSAVAQGDGDSARTGNSIFARSLNIRGQAIFSAAGTDPQFMRVMVVLDQQQIADSPSTLGVVLENNGYNSHLNKASVGRFKVLYNKVIELDSVKNKSVPIDINIAMRHHIRYNGTASTDIQKGGLYIMAMSSEAVNGPKLVFDARLSYHDN